MRSTRATGAAESAYFTPLIGGWIADQKLGYRNSVLLGGVIFMTGYFLMSVRSEAVVYVALACLECGRTFKGCTSDPKCPKCGGVDVEVADTPARKGKRAKKGARS